MKRIVAISCLFTAACLNWCAAGEFRNLGFEDVVLVAHAQVEKVLDVLPGWSLSWNSNQVDTVLINDPQIAGPYFAVGSKAWFPSIVEAGWAVHSRVLNAWWRLEQTGTVPSNTKWLTYRTLETEMQVEINREVIPPLNRQSWEPFPNSYWVGFAGTPTNVLYDISKYAGQEVTLALVGPVLGNSAYFDSIQFVSAPPSLTVEHSGQEVLLSWPADSSSYILQMSDSPAAAGIWERVWILPVIKGDQQTVKVQIANERKFFRLNVGSYIEMTW